MTELSRDISAVDSGMSPANGEAYQETESTSLSKLAQFQTHLQIIFPPGFDTHEAAGIQREEEAKFRERGLKILRDHPYMFDGGNLPIGSTSEDVVNFRSLDTYTLNHFREKLHRLGISADYLNQTSSLLTKQINISEADQKGHWWLRTRNIKAGSYSSDGISVIPYGGSLHALAAKIAHENSHTSRGEAIVIRKRFGRVERRTVPGLPPFIEEGLAEWDQREIFQKLAGTQLGEKFEINSAYNISPESTQIDETIFQGDKLNHKLISLFTQSGSSEQFELLVVRKLAGLLGYYASQDKANLSEADCVVQGRDIIEKLRYSRELSKDSDLRKKIKGISSLNDTSIFIRHLFRMQGHPQPKHLAFLLTSLHEAERKIGKRF